MKIFRDFLGFKCLKILYNTIRETASENGGIIYRVLLLSRSLNPLRDNMT